MGGGAFGEDLREHQPLHGTGVGHGPGGGRRGRGPGGQGRPTSRPAENRGPSSSMVERPQTEELKDGYFIEPILFTRVSNDMRLAREEIFGPVLSVIPFQSEEDLIRQANDTSYGLTAGIWTKDIQKAHRVAHALRAGTVWVNSYRTLSFNTPFGGYKMSGMGRENGLESLKDYTQVKSVWAELSGQTRDPFTLGLRISALLPAAMRPFSIAARTRGAASGFSGEHPGYASRDGRTLDAGPFREE